MNIVVSDYTTYPKQIGYHFCKGETLEVCPSCGLKGRMREFSEYTTFTHKLAVVNYVPVEWEFCRIDKEEVNDTASN